MNNIIYWGATGQARVLREFSKDLGFNLVALFDNGQVSPPFDDVPLYHGKEFETWIAGKECSGIAAIGGANGKARLEIHQMFKENGVEVVTLIHPKSFIAKDAVVSEGSQIMANASVCTNAQLGASCLINTAASVDHDCILGEGVHIGPGARLAGEVTVGSNSFVGTGAVVLPRVRIGANSIVGAGSVVTRDVEPGSIVYGNPARFARESGI